MSKNKSKSIGGKARAEMLSPERRSEIAKKAAKSRWATKVKNATHGASDRPLVIGENEIGCYVLEDGTRVLSQRGLQSGIGMSQSGGRAGEQRIVTLLTQLGNKGIDIKDLSARIENPIEFYPPSGGRTIYGFEATILADICDVILEARKHNVLHPQQYHYADACEILVRGFARVGIIALVDAATGFERDRAASALAEILEKYIAKELQPWVKTFPDEFYEQLFRLRGLDFKSHTVRRPQYFGHLTNDIVYKRLAPQVLEELDRSTPRDDKGRRKNKLFQGLTPDLGHPKLREHMSSVITIMKLSSEYQDFILKLNQIHPQYNETLSIDLGHSENDDISDL